MQWTERHLVNDDRLEWQKTATYHETRLNDRRLILCDYILNACVVLPLLILLTTALVLLWSPVDRL